MRVYTDFDLTSYNSYKIHSFCKSAYFPETETDIIEFFANKHSYILLGSGHNVILSKDYYEDDFLILNGNFNRANVEREIIEAEAGSTMKELCEVALENSLSGLEIFYDIPSSLGGAVVMNAGASGEEIKDVLIKVRYLDLIDLQVKEIRNIDIGFEYRNSFFQRLTDKIVLKVWLKLKKKDKSEINEKMETIRAQRWAKQPKEYPNAGSVFKRPKGHYVGALIEELGLKGYKVGGAKISEKHGGFIINFNGATGMDVLSIIDEVKKQVWENYQVKLEVEQRVI